MHDEKHEQMMTAVRIYARCDADDRRGRREWMLWTEREVGGPYRDEYRSVYFDRMRERERDGLLRRGDPIPEHVAVRLDLSELEKREVTTAEGRRVAVPYVGPVQVTFGNRSCFTGAFVLGDGVLLGSIPLEDMDLIVNSRRREITVNPESPDVPSAIVKGFFALRPAPPTPADGALERAQGFALRPAPAGGA